MSFEEAQTIFLDDGALLTGDPEHSDKEDRFILLGRSTGRRILVVCHCYRRFEEVIRIISARKANRSERDQYERRSRR